MIMTYFLPMISMCYTYSRWKLRNKFLVIFYYEHLLVKMVSRASAALTLCLIMCHVSWPLPSWSSCPSCISCPSWPAWPPWPSWLSWLSWHSRHTEMSYFRSLNPLHFKNITHIGSFEHFVFLYQGPSWHVEMSYMISLNHMLLKKYSICWVFWAL